MNNNNEIQKKRRRHMRRGTKLFVYAVVLLIALAVVSIGFRMFGPVNMSSSEVGNITTSITTTGTATSDTTTAGTPESSALNSTAAETTTGSKTGSSAPLVSNRYIQPAGAEWNIKLVNPWNPIDAKYSPPLVAYNGDKTKMFDSRAIDKLKALIAAGKQYKISVASLYRSIQLQTDLFEKEVKKVMSNQGKSRAEAETIAATVVARPITSEHHLGLAADLLFGGYPALDQSNENTPAYKWLQEHCADYGFILRYPKDKEDVTGVIFEPWHYRYVGEEAAREIMLRRITLEEYLQEKGK